MVPRRRATLMGRRSIGASLLVMRPWVIAPWTSVKTSREISSGSSRSRLFSAMASRRVEVRKERERRKISVTFSATAGSKVEISEPMLKRGQP